MMHISEELNNFQVHFNLSYYIITFEIQSLLHFKTYSQIKLLENEFLSLTCFATNKIMFKK